MRSHPTGRRSHGFVPWDYGVWRPRKAGRPYMSGSGSDGAGAEIAAIAAEEAFDSLRAPVRRVATPDWPIPFSPALEKQLYPNKEKIVAAVRLQLA